MVKTHRCSLWEVSCRIIPRVRSWNKVCILVRFHSEEGRTNFPTIFMPCSKQPSPCFISVTLRNRGKTGQATPDIIWLYSSSSLQIQLLIVRAKLLDHINVTLYSANLTPVIRFLQEVQYHFSRSAIEDCVREITRRKSRWSRQSYSYIYCRGHARLAFTDEGYRSTLSLFAFVIVGWFFLVLLLGSNAPLCLKEMMGDLEQKALDVKWHSRHVSNIRRIIEREREERDKEREEKGEE